MHANVFNNCETVAEVEFEFICRASPENLYWDGERNQEDGNRAYQALVSQYQQRIKELTK